MTSLTAKIEHWEADEYVITISEHGPIGVTFHKHDADAILRWLNTGGLSIIGSGQRLLSSEVAKAHREYQKLAETWKHKHKAGSTDLMMHGYRQAECECARQVEALAPNKEG